DSFNSTEQLFFSINKSIKNSGIKDAEIQVLLDKLSELEKSVGSSEFSGKYNEFIQLAANHMTILAPYIPALTNLLSV
ncbi:MAG: hypothetical protein R8K20_07195, partial [Gallionellaceae bacterium]